MKSIEWKFKKYEKVQLFIYQIIELTLCERFYANVIWLKKSKAEMEDS